VHGAGRRGAEDAHNTLLERTATPPGLPFLTKRSKRMRRYGPLIAFWVVIAALIITGIVVASVRNDNFRDRCEARGATVQKVNVYKGWVLNCVSSDGRLLESEGF
jgi:hypothetical protein